MFTSALTSGLTGIVLIILFIAIQVAIARWVFRINDIISRLDLIAARLERLINFQPSNK
jgi:hypothetical protein